MRLILKRKINEKKEQINTKNEHVSRNASKFPYILIWVYYVSSLPTLRSHPSLPSARTPTDANKRGWVD